MVAMMVVVPLLVAPAVSGGGGEEEEDDDEAATTTDDPSAAALPSLLVCGTDEGFLLALNSSHSLHSHSRHSVYSRGTAATAAFAASSRNRAPPPPTPTLHHDPSIIASREPLARYTFTATGVPSRLCEVDAVNGVLISVGSEYMQVSKASTYDSSSSTHTTHTIHHSVSSPPVHAGLALAQRPRGRIHLSGRSGCTHDTQRIAFDLPSATHTSYASACSLTHLAITTIEWATNSDQSVG